MRVLHVTSHLDIGGVTSYVTSVARAMAQRGHQVTVASRGGEGVAALSAAGVGCWRVPLGTSAEFGPQALLALCQLSRRLRRQRADVIHAHTRIAQVVAAALSRSLGIPFVTTWHGFFHPNLGRRLCPCTGDLTVAISEPVREHLMRDFRVAPHRIRLIPHGIDPAPFERPIDAAAQSRCRSRLLPEGGPVVGTVARLVASKGVDQLIRCLPLIRRRSPEARLLIVGDGPERRQLERLAVECGVSDEVRFAGSMPETPLVLSLMDVFVFLPAEQEGFGLSLLEAMASGCPVVAVRRGQGAAWVLDEAGVAETVPPGDLDGLASAVARWLEDRDAARRAAAQGRQMVRERYALDRAVDALEAVYRTVASQRGA